MARKSVVSIDIYKRHIALNRYVNDIWIFTIQTLPLLIAKRKSLAKSTSLTKKVYSVPSKSKGSDSESRRRDEEIAQLYQNQIDRGTFETNIVSIVSRTEAFIQECLFIAIKKHPQKLAVIAEKSGIPLELLLANQSRDDIINEYVRMRCEALMFGKPRDYLQSVEKVLSIQLPQKLVDDYIEIKASRDLIVHGSGLINKIYVEKAGTAARGKVDEELRINAAYFREVLTTIKTLSGAIQRETERVYK